MAESSTVNPWLAFKLPFGDEAAANFEGTTATLRGGDPLSFAAFGMLSTPYSLGQHPAMEESPLKTAKKEENKSYGQQLQDALTGAGVSLGFLALAIILIALGVYLLTGPGEVNRAVVEASK